MLRKTIVICLISLIAISFIPLSIYIDDDHRMNEMYVRNGVMDLSSWDYERNKRIKLDGEWEFYWNQLLPPSAFQQAGSAPPSYTALMEVPSQWNGKVINGSPLPAFGSATYRIVLTNLPFDGVYALKKTNIRFSSAVYVNGQKLFEDGLPSEEAESYRAGNIPQIGLFSSENREIEIIVHAANYDYINAGIPVSIYFGEQAAMMDHQQKSMVREFTTLAILGTLAFIYVICFAAAAFYRKTDYTLLLSAMICLLYAIYHGLIGERSLLLFIPGISFEVLYKVKDAVSLVSIIVLVVFFYQLHKNIISLKLTQVVIALLGCFLILLYFLPIGTYTALYVYTISFYQLLLIWLLIRAAMLYIRSDAASRLKPLLLFMTILTINLYSIDTILFAVSVKENLWLGQVYIVVFNIIMIFLIVLRFFEAYHTIDEMKNQLLQLDKIKDDFLSNTSHELKTPLNAIVNITATILKGVAGPLTERQAQNLSIVMGSGRRLTHLVNELLDYSKMKHGDIVLYRNSIDLRAAVDSVIRIHQFLLGGKPILLVNNIPGNFPEVYADGNRLIQVLHNLIGNAIKFSDRGAVEINAEITREMALIQVKDTGLGIEEHMQERIFQAFEQAAVSDSNHYGGTGLGLSITKKLVELHGGSIQVESRPGEGSVFTFKVPLADTASTALSSGSVEQTQQLNDARSLEYTEYPTYIKGKIDEPVLVVDDDYANLQSIINLLKLEEYSIVVVNSGRAALEELSKNQDFFLVILDITMPDMSGYEVLKRIRERFSPFELPVLMLTAKNRITEMKTSMDIGANDFVGKPFEGEELMARVKSLTKLKGSVKNAKDAEIAFLRSQIKPHFLYNALNSIAELCVDEPEQAEELTLHLSQYLRSSFDFKQLDSMTTLENELELVQAYVHIEKARFGSRLHVDYDVDANLTLGIPPLILQPLVENAIRHGLMSNLSGGKVMLAIKNEADNVISFAVEDNGRGMSEQKLEEVLKPDLDKRGVGLWNISQRIKLIYGKNIHVESAEGIGTKVSFAIPAQPIKRTGG